jgi:hypothetical protein
MTPSERLITELDAWLDRRIETEPDPRVRTRLAYHRALITHDMLDALHARFVRKEPWPARIHGAQKRRRHSVKPAEHSSLSMPAVKEITVQTARQGVGMRTVAE